jgi:DNA-binding transcriptional regulator YiaG
MFGETFSSSPQFDRDKGAMLLLDAMDVTGAQVRAARALLGISGEELARRADVSLSTVRRFEDEIKGGSTLGQRVIVQTLADMGIEFIGTRGVQLSERR